MAELHSCKLFNSSCSDKSITYILHEMVEITDGKQCQNSVLWRVFIKK